MFIFSWLFPGRTLFLLYAAIMKIAESLYTDLRHRGLVGFLTSLSTVYPRVLRHLIVSFYEWGNKHFPFIWRLVDWFSLLAIDICRFFAGYFAARGLDRCRRPQKPLVLYEFEGCPFCRKVRETLSVLGLDCMIYPCPRETLEIAGYCKESRFRPVVKEAGGSLMFPYFEDPNTGVKMYNSDEIIKYLWSEYGVHAEAPWNYSLAKIGIIEMLALPLTTFCRPMMWAGILRIPSEQPKKPLELWGCEASGSTRRVREVLSSLEIPYLLHTTAVNSGKTVPSPLGTVGRWFSGTPVGVFLTLLSSYTAPAFSTVLKDPNTNVELSGSSAIAQYLQETYQKGSPPKETWLMYGAKTSAKPLTC
ncbi:glutathione s- n-terminal domain containing protein [Cystoisospora suis]|uniref:Glutathione s-n-terminal domain containing protein n=1 Tax=Cystoisospora suis TaxID=483139 RepID=A0A2C6KRC6_9APIC|nr:glutathione s- n-terminal domain containing protein [Cystoisospora suis]